MNSTMIEKNIAYQQQIEQIAKMLFYAFYYNEEEAANYLPDVQFYDNQQIRGLMEKADKVFQYFKSAEEAKKTIHFLQVINPIKAKEIFDIL